MRSDVRAAADASAGDDGNVVSDVVANAARAREQFGALGRAQHVDSGWRVGRAL